MELLELLSFYKFPSYDIPITCGSAMSALNGTNEEIGKNAILKLMDAIHSYIPDSVRVLDRSFLMPNEGIFSIQLTFLIRILHSLKHSDGQLETPLFIYVRTATWINLDSKC